MKTEKNPYIECGRIVNTHGINGTVKVESWCDSPQVLANLQKVFVCKNNIYNECKVINSQIHKKLVLMQLDNIGDLDTAMAMKGITLYAARDDIPLPENGYFISDVIGFDIVDADNGRIYGKLKEIFNTGASNIYLISTDCGERMMPAVDEFIIEIDFENDKVFVRPIDGMFN